MNAKKAVAVLGIVFLMLFISLSALIVYDDYKVVVSPHHASSH